MTSKPNSSRDPLRPIPADEELDAELATHFDLLVERFTEQGMTPPEARRAARERFGDPSHIREQCAPLAGELERRTRLNGLLEDLQQDVGFAVRTLRRAPLFTAVAVLTLAVATGANSAIFSVVNTVLLRPLPYTNAKRVVTLTNSYPGTGMLAAAVSPPEFADLQDQVTTYDALAAMRPQPMSVSGACAANDDCAAQRVSAYVVSPNLFTLLGASPHLGRGLQPEDGAASAAPAVVISHDLWVQRFHADSAILGRTITAAGVVRTIVGVMPHGVRFPDLPVGHLQEPGDLWIPYSFERDRADGRGNQFLVVLARAKTGIDPARHRADLALIESRFKSRFPERYTGPAQWRLQDVTLRTAMVGDVRPALLVLWIIVGLVLLIACANVANLLLARGAARTTEMAVRAAMGAGRRRLVRQLCIETLVLGALAGTAGIALSVIALRLLSAFAPPSLPQVAAVTIDRTMLAYSIVIAIGATVICSILPAFQLANANLQSSLRSGQRGSGGSRASWRLRRALVTVEVALTLVVLVSAGLMVRTFSAAQHVRPVFKADSLLTFEIALPRASYANAAAMVAFHSRVKTSLTELPGVRQVSAIYPLPLDGGRWSGSFFVAGKEPGPGEEEPNAQYSVALPDYFSAMQIGILQGREFTLEDGPDRPRVVVVNETLANAQWPGQSAIGKRISTIDQQDGEFAEVIGVVRTVQRLGATEPPAPQIYLSQLQHVERRISYVIRTDGTPLAVLPAVRAVVRGADAALPLARVNAMRTLVEESLSPQRFNASVLGVFSIVALILASGGLFGVISYLVTQRTHEIGVRVALGGTPSHITRWIVRDGMTMAATGLVLGLLLTWYATKGLQGLLFGVSRADPITWSAVVALLIVVSFLASWLPAQRAARVDPVTSLRGS